MPSRRSFLRIGAGVGLAAVSSLVTGTPGIAPAARRLGGVDWTTLRRNLAGDLVLPGDAGYESARRPESMQFDGVRPQAVAMCESTMDVSTAVRFAGDNGLHAVPRSGGHSFGGYSTTDGLILDVSRMNHVLVHGSSVTVGSGTQQVDALGALAPHGLLLAGGQCPTVGVGGFVQGGGIGMLTRRSGLAADRMTGAEVVLADGRTVRASRQENPDLFWALRGNGGGNFGVVTSYELEPVRVSSMVSYKLMWPFEAARRVLDAWQPWAVDAPWDLAASASVFTPDAATAPPQVSVYGAWFGSRAELDRMLAELVASVGSAPTSHAVTTKAVHDAMMEWYGCAQATTEQCHRVGATPEARIPRSNFYRTRNRMYAGPVPGVGDMLDTFEAGGRAGQFRMIYFETLGGRAGVPARRDTAFVHRDTRMLCGYSIALTTPDYTPEDTAACEEWLTTGFGLLDRDSLGESYQNFIDPALTDWRRSYYAENYPKLVAVKDAYDPHHFFRFDRAVG